MCDAKPMLALLQAKLPPQRNPRLEPTLRKGRAFLCSAAVYLNREGCMLPPDISEDRNGVSCTHPTITCALTSERIDQQGKDNVGTKGRMGRKGRTIEDKLDAVAFAGRPHGGSSEKEHVRGGIILFHDPRPTAVGNPCVEIRRIDEGRPVPALLGIGKLASPQDECEGEYDMDVDVDVGGPGH